MYPDQLVALCAYQGYAFIGSANGKCPYRKYPFIRWDHFISRSMPAGPCRWRSVEVIATRLGECNAHQKNRWNSRWIHSHRCRTCSFAGWGFVFDFDRPGGWGLSAHRSTGGRLVSKATVRYTKIKGLQSLNCKPLFLLPVFGAPGAIRTPDPLVRSQVLYPAELRAQDWIILHSGCI